MLKNRRWADWIWDGWCLFSIIGIWPRFIEPHLLSITRLSLPIANLPAELSGLKILHFSDLHWNGRFSLFYKKLIRKINRLKPDLIVFTGDFLCRSQLENGEGLKQLLNSLHATSGCFAILGNHDYASFVTVNSQGDYDSEIPSLDSSIGKGFKRLFHPVCLTNQVTLRASQTKMHSGLTNLLMDTPFVLLNNTTKLVSCKGSQINVCGLEEYTLGRFNPDLAFKDYDSNYPGIILSHNPDTLMTLKHYPGDIILSGHTHGGQVNLPGLWKRFTRIEHLLFKRGLKVFGKKWAYINRGISSIMKFRWFALPEITLITLLG